MKRIIIANLRSCNKPHRRVRAAGALFGLALALAATAPIAAEKAAEITAKMEGDSLIRIVSPGLFETDVTKREGFVGSFYDLKHDPGKKFDVGPVHDENGILWTKTGCPKNQDGSWQEGSWFTAPCEKLELLESGPARVRITISGPYCRDGRTAPKERWPELRFEQTFTMYPTGSTYIDYCLVTEKPLPLKGFLLIIKSNGSWSKSGKGAGKGEVHSASDAGEKIEYGKTSCLALQWSDGPTHFQDFLMIVHKGKFPGTYWDEGYLDHDYRTGLKNLVGPDLPAGRKHISLLFRFDHDINSPQAAMRFAGDYRSPDKLAVKAGQPVTDDEGDIDTDGYNETEGCYVLKAAPGGVEFTLHGSKTPRIEPAFKVKSWKGRRPKTVTLGGSKLAAGTDFVADVKDNTLVIQVQKTVSEDADIRIAAQ